MVLTKLIGAAAIVFGLAMIVFFPYTSSHQQAGMTNLGILIGIVSIGIGLLLLAL